MIDLKNIFKISEDRFFGFEFDDNGCFEFLVPKQLYPQSYDLLNQIKLLKTYLDILSKYIKSKENDIYLNYSKNIIPTINVLSGMTLLIDDYIEHGEFNLYNSYFNRGQKRINWRKTIEDKDTLIQGNMVVYNSFISKQKKIDSKNEFFIIYQYALKKSLQILKGEKEKVIKINYSSGKIKTLISNFQDKNFKDRENNIIESLKKIFLTPNSLFNTQNEIYKSKYHYKFEHIWEFMIESIVPENFKMNNEVNMINNFNGEYYRPNGEKICNGSIFNPDHIFINGNNVSILDSKFYNFYDDINSKKEIISVPKTESISKQENYKKILKRIYLNHKIHNYFIFPKNIKENKKPEYFALHKSKTSELFLIKCIALDVEEVIRHFMSKINYNEFINLINEINTELV